MIATFEEYILPLHDFDSIHNVVSQWSNFKSLIYDRQASFLKVSN